MLTVTTITTAPHEDPLHFFYDAEHLNIQTRPVPRGRTVADFVSTPPDEHQGPLLRRLQDAFPWMKRVKRVNGWPVYSGEALQHTHVKVRGVVIISTSTLSLNLNHDTIRRTTYLTLVATQNTLGVRWSHCRLCKQVCTHQSRWRGWIRSTFDVQ